MVFKNSTNLLQNRAKRQFQLLAAFRCKPCYASHASLPPTHHNGVNQNGVFPRGSYVLVPGPLFALRFSALAGGNVIPPGGLLHGRKKCTQNFVASLLLACLIKERERSQGTWLSDQPFSTPFAFLSTARPKTQRELIRLTAKWST